MEPKNGTHYTAIDTPPKVKVGPFEETRTRVSEQNATNINTIVKQYDRTGYLPQVDREALFLDVTEMPDYRTSLDLIQKADDMFMDLPADLRARFDNDAAIFLDWTSDEDNREEMVELGMLPKPDLVEPAEPAVEPQAPIETPPKEEGVS